MMHASVDGASNELCTLEDTDMPRDRGQRERERLRELRDHCRRLRQAREQGAARSITEGAKYEVELVGAVRRVAAAGSPSGAT